MKKFGLGNCFALALATAILAWVPAADAGVPRVLTEQGRIIDSGGQPVNGQITIKFAIYDVVTAASPIWEETQAITVDDGYFSARLGEVTPLGAAVFDGSTRYLGITVGSDAEMAPRVQLDLIRKAPTSDHRTACLVQLG